MTVFLGVFIAVDASPHNFLFAACRPCASAVGGFAFAADEQFCQGVFALLGLGFSADVAFAGAPCKFLLNSAEGSRVDDGRVAVFYIVFRAFTVVDYNLFADAVGDVGLIDDGIAFVSLVGENGLYRGKLPLSFARILAIRLLTAC